MNNKDKNIKCNLLINWTKVSRILMLGIFDLLSIALSMFGALYIRYDMSFHKIDSEFMNYMTAYVWINLISTLIIFLVCGLYKSLWRYASVREMYMIVIACGISTIVQDIGMHLLEYRVPRSYPFMYFFILLVLATCGRFIYRIIRITAKMIRTKNNDSLKNTMIIGAGDAGVMLVKELTTSNFSRCNVACFIDDDKYKTGTRINGIPVIGGREKIVDAIGKYDIKEIIIAIPSATAEERKGILEICKSTGCKIKMVPGIYQIVNNEVSVSALRNVEIEDLLGREPIQSQVDTILNNIEGRIVLVTGGGGSIGSELCRQIAKHNPKKLIILDIYENNAYDIQQELIGKNPDLDLEVLIGSVRNTHRVESIFKKYKPEIVYHAAAHKHVPLMENSPNEAVKNNVIGTYNVAEMAGKYGTDTFVLISTDKAVNPTNIMGATKRLCEKVVQSLDGKYNTKYVAVRFGNVLGSNGSVIPLFKKQIAEGGPVTVTDKNIIRYFMTIPEAVSLVLQAGAYAKGGEIFILDMGEPVKIDDLAHNLIRLSGLQPGVDIKIEYIGLRPGEKLYEEKLMAEEGLLKTENSLIHIAKPIEFDREKFLEELWELKALAYEDRDSNDIYRKVKEMAPTFKWEP